MNVGMLWFDGDHGSNLADRLERAAAYYRSKYGRRPTVCFLNPATANGEPPKSLAALELRASDAVLPDHFWLGIEEVRSSAAALPPAEA